MELAPILSRLGKAGGFAIEAVAAMAVALKDALEKADIEGYQRGYTDGLRAAREEMKKRFAAVMEEEGTARFHEPTAPFEGVSNSNPTQHIVPRAPRGSVAPAVLAALQASNRGMSPKEVADQADIPENSARGSLNKLRRDGKVEKRGQLWLLSKPEYLRNRPDSGLGNKLTGGLGKIADDE